MRDQDDDHQPTTSTIQSNKSEGDRSAAAALAGVRILVVDDDPMTLEVLVELFGDVGAHVIAASSVSEGIVFVQQHRPDIIVSDIRMPERDGYQLMKVVRTLPPGQGGSTPAIALSGLGRKEDRVRALLAGYQVHLTKPIHARHLIATVARLVARSPR